MDEKREKGDGALINVDVSLAEGYHSGMARLARVVVPGVPQARLQAQEEGSEARMKCSVPEFPMRHSRIGLTTAQLAIPHADAQ